MRSISSRKIGWAIYGSVLSMASTGWIQPPGRFGGVWNLPANPHSLGENYLYFIVEDHAGVLWVASPIGNGLSARNVKNGVFTRYSFRSESPGSQSVVGVS